MAFKQAIKRDAKLRMALSGSAGSGKSFTALKMATELAGGKRVAAVDTEHGSLSKYAHTDKCGGPGVCEDPSHFDFDVDEPETYDPRGLVTMIDYAVSNGYGALVIDSLSHYWMGTGGELEMVDNAAKSSRSGNSWGAWKTVTPVHNTLIDTMISAPIHIIVTMRTKTEWVTEKDEKGKTVPVKIGMQPIMRDGIEFEFDVAGEMDQANTLTISKSRCSALQGKSIHRPGKATADILREWLAGAPVEPKSSPVATAAEGRQAQRSPRTEPATASVQSGGPAETSPGMSGPAPTEGITPAQRAPSDPYAPPRTTVGGKVADAPVSAPASYKNEQQRKAEPLQIPEELLPLFNNMSTSTGMVNARKMIIDECAKVYGPEAAEADWLRIGAKHRVLGVGKKIVGDVQRALLELWAIKEYMEKKLERDAREAPPLKNVNEFQASEDDIPAIIGASIDEAVQQPLPEWMTKEEPGYAD